MKAALDRSISNCRKADIYSQVPLWYGFLTVGLEMYDSTAILRSVAPRKLGNGEYQGKWGNYPINHGSDSRT
jgi:hypothetical protein